MAVRTLKPPRKAIELRKKQKNAEDICDTRWQVSKKELSNKEYQQQTETARRTHTTYVHVKEHQVPVVKNISTYQLK